MSERAFMTHSSAIRQDRGGISNGDTAVHKTLIKTLGLSVATAALALFAYGASAQAPAKKEPAAAKPAACNSLKDEAACKARTDCEWVSASIDPKTKKEKKKAYCKSKPKPKEPPKKAEPKK